jgi:hypothetical protein
VTGRQQWRRQSGGGSTVTAAAASEAWWQHQQSGTGSAAAKQKRQAVLQWCWQRKTAVAGTKTTAETAMTGDTVNNQLKGVAEETTAAAMAMAAETATATKMVTIKAAGWVNGKTEPKKYS